MVEDILTPTGYGNPVVKARCPSELRHALGLLLAERGGSEAALVRGLLEDALTSAGWSAERRQLLYLEHRAHCLRTATTDIYGRGH